MSEEKIDRINALAHKQQSVGLTQEEKDEQAKLRQEYITAVRESLVGNLEHTYIVDEKGNKKKVKKKNG
ncbi:MAG: DUF896 domain-containing protein [Eubacteriales bacterium]|nr:DUF896 domain-containing protein [Eubacteriales bacterium]